MSAALASEVLQACSRAGVREFCVCAGARNVALVVALERSTGCQVWHFFEERSAAFFALGRMMKTGIPVAVVTTSGTAVAELLPATVEAFYQSLPLVLLTADRPPRFRGTGAPQAIEQVGIFGEYACCLDLVEAISFDEELWDAIKAEAPVHLNVCFEEPDRDSLGKLCGVEFGDLSELEAQMMLACPTEPWREIGMVAPEKLVSFLEGDRQGLVVLLGNMRLDEFHSLKDFLKVLGAPVVAEAGSGLREKLPGLIVREVPADVRRVLRIGGVPSTRFWRDLEARSDLEVLSVSRGMFSGLARDCEVVPKADWDGMVEWGGIAAAVRSENIELGKVELGGEARWFRLLSEYIPRGAAVFLGNSLPIREWNLAATYEDRELRCFSCRGANGIDGALSTFLGLSCEEEESWAIVGDLTALYDLSAPWILRELEKGKRRIVVINNGGGKIFEKLPSLAGLADVERKAIVHDHSLDLEQWAAMWGMTYVGVEAEEDLVFGDNPVVVIEIFIGGEK